MRVKTRKTAFQNQLIWKSFLSILVLLIGFPLFMGSSTPAATTVTVAGQGGKGTQSLPDNGGPFDINIPLTKNAVNTLVITAVDAFGTKVSQEIPITQVSLDSIVVSRVTTERLSVQQVEQLVSEGVIKLDNPENYHVSKFDIVLTIAQQPVAISVAVPTPKEEEKTGWETYKLPKDALGWGPNKPPEEKPQIIVFEQRVSLPQQEPISIPGVIIIEGRIKSLKEFYNVRLLLMNTSGIFTLKDVMANIEFPDGGLSKVLPADGIISFGNILPGDGGQPGQVEKEFIIRGDEIGLRRVKVNFGGSVAGPGIAADKAIPFNGSAFSNVEVKGPPTFKVKVFHPDIVAANVSYELRVDITNTGDIPAMYASLELEVGADAELVKCQNTSGTPECTTIQGADIRNFGHILQGQTVSEIFTVNPLKSGIISSCVGVSDQNITLQVYVGTLGCLVGHFPPEIGVPEGVPTVSIVPTANAFGISIDSPVTAFFSEKMNESTVTTGLGGTFNIYDRGSRLIPGQLRFVAINNKTVAIWQVNDGMTNRLAPNTEHTVVLTRDILDPQGNRLFNEWTSRFTTTGMGANDTTPPTLNLSIEPPVNPNYVLPGQIIKVDAYAADQGSGVARVELRIKDLSVSGSPYVLVDQKTVFSGNLPPYIFSIDSANLLPGRTYQLLGTAYDGMGNTQNATLSFVLAASADPPTIVLPVDDPTPTVLYGISVSLTPEQITGGIREVRYYLDGSLLPFKSLTLAPYQAGLGTLPLALGNHTIRVVAEDGLGQTGEDTYTFNLAENLNMPTVQILGTTSGAQFVTGSSFTMRGEASDPVGLQSVRFYLDTAGGTPVASGTQAFTVNTTGLSEGLHTVYMVATNVLGVSNNLNDPASSVQFNIVPLPNGDPPNPPAVSMLSYPEKDQVTITGTSVAGARIDITNTTLGLSLTANANSSGAFNSKITADAGHVLSLVAYDFNQSQRPSNATTVTVPAPPVLTQISVSPLTMEFSSANAYQDILVTGYYDHGSSANLTSRATFSSSNAAVASVNSSGRVVALSSGNAMITATMEGQTAQVTATVSIIILTHITVDPANINFVAVGQTQPLAVTAHYSDNTFQLLTSGVSYATGDPNVATVSSNGMITARGDGSTQITVTCSGVAPVQVGVSVNTGLDPAPSVSLLSPANGTEVERGRNLSINVRVQDTIGGVTKIYLEVTGETTYSELVQISPASLDVTRSFNLTISDTAAVGGTITVTTRAEDSSGNNSSLASIILNVVDRTAPAVSITQPAAQTAYNYGDTVTITISAMDAVGVSQIRYETSGALNFSGSKPVGPGSQVAGAAFSFVIPYGVTDPDVKIHAYARDAVGNEGPAVPVDIILTNADITPPETLVTAVASPGSSASTTVTYQVTSGLEDLDYVLLYFRRNGIGTFNRYTDADGGHPQGKYLPQSGNSGTIVFDSTKMGGDGTFEFYSLGVDKAGNLEPVTGIADQTIVFTAGTVWTVITSPLVIGEGDNSFDDKNLRVIGTNLTVNGIHFFRNVDLLNGATLTHAETTTTLEYGLNLTLWTLTIDATSSINLNGRGYIGGRNSWEQGRTIGNVEGSYRGAGGSYGGLGGRYDVKYSPNSTYGDLTNPINLGSGGGAWDLWDGGDGGGLLMLNAVNIAVDGAIQANGTNSEGSASGAGSGGGLNITSKTISGAGTLQTNGGNQGTGGGGGRIAVYYLDLETLNKSGFSSQGGIGGYGSGANGSIFLKQEEKTNGGIVLTGQGISAPWTDLHIPAGYTFDSLTLLNNARVIVYDPIIVTGKVWITGNSILTHNSSNESGLSIQASVVQVDAGSAMDVTGRGYWGGRNSWEQGRTMGNVYGSYRGAGGSYGGLGGRYDVNYTPNSTYGDLTNPGYLGSGGGAWDLWDGGDGGGRIQIEASEAVIVNGAIRANGGEAQGSASGAGSGGSILIRTSQLSGDGFIAANGGNQGTGGGGGRISVYCDYVQEAHNLNNLYNLTAFGGRGSYDTRRASAGTVFLKTSNQDLGNLYVDDNVVDGMGNPNGTSPESTPLTLIGFGVTAGVDTNTLTTDGTVTLLAGDLAGMRLNPDIKQGETFLIQTNTVDTITVVSPNENGVAFSALAGAGKTYAGLYRFDNVFFRRGGNLVAGDLLEVTDTMQIAEYGLLTHYKTTTTFVNWLDLTAVSLIIETGSRIEVTGRGYMGGRDSWEQGRTIGNVYGSYRGAGGSYGGLGGKYDSNWNPTATYGDLTNPINLGSGGGAWDSWDGGDGGGLVLINAGNLILDGSIIANGGEAQGSASGAGSGGGINIVAVTLNGAGLIQANGGNQGTGGGGGRIAINSTGSLSFPDANIVSKGGMGAYGNAGHGTIYIKKPGQTYADFIVDGQGNTAPDDTTILPGDLNFNNVTLKNGAKVNFQNKISVTGSLRIEGNSILSANDVLVVNNTLTITGNSTLTHDRANENGVSIQALVVQVDAGSAIDVTGRGYIGGRNGWEQGRTLGNVYGSYRGTGGSYGGLGGKYDVNYTPNSTYGDLTNPGYLGSGGGAWDWWDGGDGGGRIRIQASQALIVNGAIRANGGEAQGSASGAGSGGSILIRTSQLSGDGFITANGGNQGTGGGGGRIAVYCDSVQEAHNLNNFYNLTAFGGRGNYDTHRSSAGTVFFKYSNQLYGNLFVDDNVIDAGGNPNGTAPESTPLTLIGFGVTTAVDGATNTLTTDGRVIFLPGDLAGMRFNPDTSQSESFVIQTNTVDTITVGSPNENGVAFSALAGAGKTYAGLYRFDNVFFRRGGNLVVGDLLEVTNTIKMAEYSLLTHYESTSIFINWLDLTVGNLIIETGSRIEVTGRGYIGGRNSWEQGQTVGNVYGSYRGAGGSYGGLGGRYDSNWNPSGTYGDLTNPQDLGSGGGAWDWPDGGDGGGLILINAGNLTLNGSIIANGGEAQGSVSGAGSGGSINIVTGTLSGDGYIRANGGNQGTGGGGGRVAVRYDTLAIDGNHITSAGGIGTYGLGQTGTVSLESN